MNDDMHGGNRSESQGQRPDSPGAAQAAKNSRQLNLAVDLGVAEAFRASCAAKGASMASALEQCMADYSGMAANAKPAAPSAPLSTRRKRRRALDGLVIQLKEIRDAEVRAQINMPENLVGSSAYYSYDEIIDQFGKAIYALEMAYPLGC